MIIKKFLLTLLCAVLSANIAFAQNASVQGTIVDENGEPVIGASVFIKGTKTGAVTDIDGKFSLKSSAGKTLVITYVGYEKTEATAKDGMKIMLTPTSHALGEVVVTGMQKMDKRLFTGATAKIDADKAKLDGIADVSRALEGRISGVSVQNVSGTFGTAPKIRVRGATSICTENPRPWCHINLR